MHYLVTGHTGFKGSWLTLMLTGRGHTVSGLSLDPVAGSLFERARIGELVERDHRVDIRDAEATARAITETAPDVVLHLAAQPLVRESYRAPRATFETNAMGTLNVIEAVQNTPSVKAHVVITTDKVYRNVNQAAGYVETDPLGGFDPYSASKAMADLLVQSWVRSFLGTPTAIARAGNVIGGGDVCDGRLLPDLIEAFSEGRSPLLRYPESVRPWQHVLDCLNGYLSLADALLGGRGTGEWNFGPGPDSFVDVAHVAELVASLYDTTATWTRDEGDHPHEAGLLALDATKAESELGWHNKLTFAQSVGWTVEWEKATQSGADARATAAGQVADFEVLA
ncbi:CDP-glucose 4,6-dehydratase [Demequina lutea]|uniref:CDP-glucose 4,6-dehydratase n=1 Tax=Demequina lutea TaxID=431489 RepID=A0A7Z0CL26_9MICO|nr:CDP-glucose 4,6-dehydratase [Demequina lutea]NYI42452.1 CDP-glucose 4,6-dehydratase [Demequina lutea]